jgi:superfamily II DNA or RNA helicase
MFDLDVSNIDSVNVRVDCNRGIAQELSDYFTFKVPGYKFMPAYRSRMWNGDIKLFNVHTGLIYAGLTDYIKKFADERQYTVTFPARNEINITPDAVRKFMQDFLQVHVGGKKVDAHDHQVNAVHHAMQQERCLLLSPTGSGKSLIIYTLLRYYLDKIPSDKKVLIVVPTVSLVEQMLSDFTDYSSANGWSVKSNCHKIMSGEEKNSDKRVVVSTWQSIYKQSEKWFQQFAAVIGDEAHLFKSKSLTAIMSKLKDCPYRVGTTGTLDGTNTHRLVLEGLFGRAYEVTKTKELMEKRILSDLKIDCLLLSYPDLDRQAVKRAKYQDEIRWIIGSQRRNKFIADMCSRLKGNSLILFQFVEDHGKVLNSLVRACVPPERKVFFVHGGTEAADREEIRKIVESESDAVIIASYGTFSTGISIRRLHNIIFASPSKSRIRVLQSIGRQLRVSQDKTVARLYDLGDDLSWKTWKNHTLRHMNERMKLYEAEGFEHKLVKIQLGEDT